MTLRCLRFIAATQTAVAFTFAFSPELGLPSVPYNKHLLSRSRWLHRPPAHEHLHVIRYVLHTKYGRYLWLAVHDGIIPG